MKNEDMPIVQLAKTYRGCGSDICVYAEAYQGSTIRVMVKNDEAYIEILTLTRYLDNFRSNIQVSKEESQYKANLVVDGDLWTCFPEIYRTRDPRPRIIIPITELRDKSVAWIQQKLLPPIEHKLKKTNPNYIGYKTVGHTYYDTEKPVILFEANAKCGAIEADFLSDTFGVVLEPCESLLLSIVRVFAGTDFLHEQNYNNIQYQPCFGYNQVAFVPDPRTGLLQIRFLISAEEAVNFLTKTNTVDDIMTLSTLNPSPIPEELTAPFISRLAIIEQKIKKVQEEIWRTPNEQH